MKIFCFFTFLCFAFSTALAAESIQLLPNTQKLNQADFSDNQLLWLVNPQNPLPRDYTPPDLAQIANTQLRAPALEAYRQMLAALQSEGIPAPNLQSAYRPYSHQRALFNEKVRSLEAKDNTPQQAQALAMQTIQPPSASEHQLGLSLDVSTDGKLSEAFAKTPVGIWLAENCHNFGFVIRYPAEKTHITKITYEPWHLRYVGIPHSQIMYENSLTLEEYHAFMAGIPLYITWTGDGYYLVFHSNSPFATPQNTAVATASKTSCSDTAPYIFTVKVNQGESSPSQSQHSNRLTP